MKLIWKGKYFSEQQLPVGYLPENAVKFKEPNTPARFNIVARIFTIPVIIIAGIVFYIKTLFHSDVDGTDIFSVWGVLLALIMIIPHEILHALSFPKKAEVQFWYSSENLMAFVYSIYPVSKLRFIFLSLLPNIIFGFFPLIGWIFIHSEFSEFSKIVYN